MKKILFILLCILGTKLSYNQNIEGNIITFLEVDANNLNQKVNWEKFNQYNWLTSSYEKQFKSKWKDISVSGIDFNSSHYNYTIHSDSLISNVTYLPLKDSNKFMEFLKNASEKEFKIKKTKNYSYLALDENVFIAWNDLYSIVYTGNKIIKSKPNEYKYTEIAKEAVKEEKPKEETVVVEEKPFDYKQEIENLQEEIKANLEEIEYFKNEIKYNQEEIEYYKQRNVQIKEDIAYLEEHKQYPNDVVEDAIEASGEAIEAEAEPEEAKEYSNNLYKTPPPPIKMPSHNKEKPIVYEKPILKIDTLSPKYKEVFLNSKRFFETSFSSNNPLKFINTFIKNKDKKSDVYFYFNQSEFYEEFMKLNHIYSYNPIYKYQYIFDSYKKLTDVDIYSNLYFNEEDIHAKLMYEYKNEKVRNSILNLYDSKFDKSLVTHLDNKDLGYISLSMNSNELFNLFYKIFELSPKANDDEFAKEIDLFMNSMKIVLDEKAISDVFPGSNLLILHDLHKEEINYIGYEYDEDYNYTEVEKTKEEVIPTFSYVFSTKNEKYWKKFLNTFLTKKYFKDNLVEQSGMKYLHFKDEVIQNLYFEIKNGKVVISNSLDKLKAKNNYTNSRIKKEITKKTYSVNLKMNDVLHQLKDEFKSNKDKKMFEYVYGNIGEVKANSYVKNKKFISEITFSTGKNHENGLMYIFDLFEAMFNSTNPSKKL
ncbi:MAG: hypothetical protein H6604_05120 [Flavobacteriales bacterium]|nr:hypothetical protein [Flavobacteriales bacterium]